MQLRKILGLCIVCMGIILALTGCGSLFTSTYSVTYDGNGATGGSVPTDSKQYAEGQWVTVLGNTGNLAKAGYVFSGWNTAANDGGTAYLSGALFTIGGGNVTLYAQWSRFAWTDQASTGSRSWTSVTSSSDGTHLAATADDGDVWTSTNSGATWTDRSASGTRNWQAIATSSDGTHLVADVGSYGSAGDIYTSVDSGATWTDQTAAGFYGWQSIVSSSDGTHFVAVASRGDIWTGVAR